jgi:hypothetical protein
MLGIHDRGIDFGVDDQRAVRAEMAAGVGEAPRHDRDAGMTEMIVIA